jgi:MinD-like ATPase involved in chromosome partitioning or flagellar assembly
MARKKKADQIRQLYNLSNTWTRKQWEHINQKGYEFAHDEQLSQDEKNSLEEQGMPTFIINRILPVVEMLNFYATANNPRWQAVGTEGSDVDVAAVLSDLCDYIWALSDGNTLYGNAINDAVTKGLGYLLVSVDRDMDNGMGEVIVTQPEPFDIYVDPKCRDMLFKDAAFILIRKVLPKNHLIKTFPDQKRKISQASSDEQAQRTWSARAVGDEDQKLFAFNDTTEQANMAIEPDGSQDELVEYFEIYEKIKVSYMNVFYRIPPSPEVMEQIKQQAQVAMQEMQAEMQVKFMETQQQLQQAVQEGKMIPERMQLELQKEQKMMQQQLQAYEQETISRLQSEASKIENVIVSEQEFKVLLENKLIADNIVDKVQFYDIRIKQICAAGDKILYEKILPKTVKDYPLIPFLLVQEHYCQLGLG